MRQVDNPPDVRRLTLDEETHYWLGVDIHAGGQWCEENRAESCSMRCRDIAEHVWRLLLGLATEQERSGWSPEKPRPTSNVGVGEPGQVRDADRDRPGPPGSQTGGGE